MIRDRGEYNPGVQFVRYRTSYVSAAVQRRSSEGHSVLMSLDYAIFDLKLPDRDPVIEPQQIPIAPDETAPTPERVCG